MVSPLKNYEKYDEVIVSRKQVSTACKNAFALVDTMHKGRRIKEVQASVETEHGNQVLLGIYIKYYEENEMSTEEQIKQEIEDAQKALERAQKKLAKLENSKKYGWWQPDKDDSYYYIDSEGYVSDTTYNNVELDHMKVENLNCFKTKKEAELERLKIVIHRKIQDIALRLNRGRKIDWSKYYQNKYFAEITEMSNGTCQVEQGSVVTNGRIDKAYCVDVHFADVVEKELEEDLKKYSRLKIQIEK